MRRTRCVERVFGTDPERVFGAYWDLRLWPAILPSIREVRVSYDDGAHQYFSMLVEKAGAHEIVSGARFAVPGSMIELCQFVPPPGFRAMRGEWRFEPVPCGPRVGTRVVAQRAFETEGSGEGAEEALERLLVANFDAFEAYFAEGVRACSSLA